MKKIIWKELNEDDPVFKQGFIISTHNKNRQDYIKHREKTEINIPVERTSEEVSHILKIKLAEFLNYQR